jgi:hypothetical protein
MNFTEFKKLMGADPLNQDQETLRARDSGPEFQQAAADALAFEQKLTTALQLPVDSDDLLADILAIPQSPARRRIPGWFAIAASLLMVIGVGSFMIDGIVQPDTIEEYVAQHYSHDGEKLLARAGSVVAADDVIEVMASWDLEAAPELLERVTYIKRCFTMDGMGAHMIVQTDQGPVNLIVMPNTVVTDRQEIRFDNMEAHLVALGSASAAIIGRQDQAIASIDSLIRNSISKSI